jgi:hypothetical protein
VDSVHELNHSKYQTPLYRICLVFLYLCYSCINVAILRLCKDFHGCLPWCSWLSTRRHVWSSTKLWSLLKIVTWLLLPAFTLKMAIEVEGNIGICAGRGTVPVWRIHIGGQSMGLHCVASASFCNEFVQSIFTSFIATSLYPELCFRKFGCVLYAWGQMESK